LENGIPCMANDGGAKAYVHSLGEALHYEFKPLGVYVTVLAAGVTNTAVIDKFGLNPKTMPMKPIVFVTSHLAHFYGTGSPSPLAFQDGTPI
jgi:short-subunit dehydrogenase